MNKFLKELQWRGVLNNITNEDKFEEATKLNKFAYVGFDPSADSLHLGNYVMIQMLNRLKAFGIKPYALVGGATGMIGDPSGKSSERNLLNPEIVNHNVQSISNQLIKYANVEILNNNDIYKEQTLFDFLRTSGKLINVNYMLEKESIKTRLETGISFTEFAYTLIQGNDFLEFYKNKNIAIQLGGSDQWGNITTGIEMIRKDVGEDNLACGITINLLTKSDGKKFGKSEKGAIFLDENKTSVYEMYQFLINQNDDDVIKLLKYLTFLTEEQITSLEKDMKENPKNKLCQKELAKEIVTNIHGEEKYLNAIKISELLFKDQIKELTKEEFISAFKSHEKIQLKDINHSLIDLLTETNIFDSRKKARESINQNAIKINSEPMTSETIEITKKHLLHDKFLVIKKGKKHYFVIELI